MADLCPICTQSYATNLQNHLLTIKLADLGPADPREPSTEYWRMLMKKWKVPEGVARTRLCMNCEHYIDTQEMRDCLANSPGSKLKASAIPVTPKWADIEGMPSAVCSRFNITCSALRTCADWEAGGPITDDMEHV